MGRARHAARPQWKAAVAHVRAEGVAERERQLSAHEARLESILAEKSAALKAQRSAMQKAIDALLAQRAEGDAAVLARERAATC